MKTTSLAIVTLLKWSADADVMMAKSFSGEELALHGISGSFHHVHKFVEPSVHQLCAKDVPQFCDDEKGDDDEFMEFLMRDAGIRQQFPALRLIGREEDSLKLLNELLSSPSSSSKSDVDIMEDLFQTSMGIANAISQPPSSSSIVAEEMKPSSDAAAVAEKTVDGNEVSAVNEDEKELKDNPTTQTQTLPVSLDDVSTTSSSDDVAEKTLEVLVNSLLEHASSASASASADEDRTTTTTSMATDAVDPVILSQKMAAFGKDILDEEVEDDSEGHSLRRRLASRLTEVTPSRGMPPCKKRGVIILRRIPLQTTPRMNRPDLGFGSKIDKCMWNAYNRKILSEPCGQAMQKKWMSQIHPSPPRHVRETMQLLPPPPMRSFTSAHSPPHRPCPRLQRKLFIQRFLRNFSLSAILSFLFMGLLHLKRNRKMSKRRRIMRAIHQNPELKAAVKSAMERDDHLDNNRHHPCAVVLSFCDSFFSILPLVGLVLLLLFTAIIAPYFVLIIGAPILGLTTTYMMVRSVCLFQNHNDSDNSSDNSKYVLLESTEPEKETKNEIHEGVPLQVV